MSKAFLIGIVIFCWDVLPVVCQSMRRIMPVCVNRRNRKVKMWICPGDCCRLSCLSRIIAGSGRLPGMGRMAEGTCAVMSYGTFGYSELISPFTEYDGCPLVVVVSPDRRHSICLYRFYFGYKIETGNYRDREGVMSDRLF